MKIVLIDNYDSFTYNLVHYVEEFNADITVLLNDQFELDELEEYDRIILSPGPGIPDEAGLLKQVIERYSQTKPVFGVCLGQQAIGEVFGGSLINLEKVYHGVATTITVLVEDDPIYKNLPKQLEVGRYHSWVINPADFPDVLEITAVDANNQIMSIRHRTLPITAVQYHPESVLTPFGKTILQNWITASL